MFSLVISLSLLLFKIDYSNQHGRMMEPAARNTAWRLNYINMNNIIPPIFDDSELFCGGIKVQYEENKGRCGLCGDNYASLKPLYETGGEFAQNYTTRIYTPGSNITVVIDLVANHMGNFTFQLCYRDSFDIKETEECFEPLKLADGGYEYEIKSKENALFPVSLTLPTNRTCTACVLRWHWRAGNNWGKCPFNTTKNDCTVQETWRNCADVAIRREFGIRGFASFDMIFNCTIRSISPRSPNRLLLLWFIINLINPLALFCYM